MFSLDSLTTGLSRLNLHESRHAMRYVMSAQGGAAVGPFDADIARTALGKLDPDQQAALTRYCHSFMPARQPSQ